MGGGGGDFLEGGEGLKMYDLVCSILLPCLIS